MIATSFLSKRGITLLDYFSIFTIQISLSNMGKIHIPYLLTNLFMPMILQFFLFIIVIVF